MKYEQKIIESERGTMCREVIKSMMKTGTQSETEKARRRFYEDRIQKTERQYGQN